MGLWQLNLGWMNFPTNLYMFPVKHFCSFQVQKLDKKTKKLIYIYTVQIWYFLSNPFKSILLCISLAKTGLFSKQGGPRCNAGFALTVSLVQFWAALSLPVGVAGMFAGFQDDGLRLGLASGRHQQVTGGGRWAVFPFLPASGSPEGQAKGGSSFSRVIQLFPLSFQPRNQQLPGISNLWVASPTPIGFPDSSITWVTNSLHSIPWQTIIGQKEHGSERLCDLGQII